MLSWVADYLKTSHGGIGHQNSFPTINLENPINYTQLQEDMIEVEVVSSPPDCYFPLLPPEEEKYSYFTHSFNPIICKALIKEPDREEYLGNNFIHLNGEVNHLTE